MVLRSSRIWFMKWFLKWISYLLTHPYILSKIFEKNQDRPLPNGLNSQIRKVLMCSTLCQEMGVGDPFNLSKIFEKNQDRPLPNGLNSQIRKVLNGVNFMPRPWVGDATSSIEDFSKKSRPTFAKWLKLLNKEGVEMWLIILSK